jgi:chromosome segregation ATPase
MIIRLLNCIYCGREIPPGYRRDKKYCDDRCIDLAYLDRHPDKRAKNLDKLRKLKGDAAAAQPGRRPASFADVIARMEEAQGATRRELATVQNSLLQVESLLRSQAGIRKDRDVAEVTTLEAEAKQRIAELTTEAQNERQRATDAVQAQAKLKQQMQEMQNELNLRRISAGQDAADLAKALEDTRNAEARCRELETKLQRAPVLSSALIPPAQDTAQANALRAAQNKIADLGKKLDAANERARKAEEADDEKQEALEELRESVGKWRSAEEEQRRKLSLATAAANTAEQRAQELDAQLQHLKKPP